MVKKYLKSIRIINILLIGILYWGLYFQYNAASNLNIDHFLLFCSVVFTLCSGYLINNYYDIESDSINKKMIENTSKKYFLILYFLHLILSFLCLFLSNLSGGWVQMVMLCHFLVFYYSLKLQHLPLIGNISVAFLCVIALSIPNYIFNNEIQINTLKVENSISSTYIVFCFFFTLIREIIKDIEDAEGDKYVKSKTFPLLIGVSSTKVLISFFIVFIIFLLAIAMISSSFTTLNLFFYLPVILVSLYFLYRLLINFKQPPYPLLSRLIKVKFFIASIWLYVNLIL